ncbi:MAG: hypothetical protein R3A45_11850 [Bdellovibrionota bacterium]
MIPSTWRSNGIGLFGGNDALTYRAYLVNSLDATGIGGSPAAGFSSSGIRDGRQKAAKAAMMDVAFTGRLDFHRVKGLIIGGSFFVGQTGQNFIDTLGNQADAFLAIVEGHLDYRIEGLQFRSLFAYSWLTDAWDVSQAVGDTVAREMFGFYAEAGYDILHFLDTNQKLKPYIRYEKVHNQHRIPAGLVQDQAQNRNIYSMGLNYQPMDLIVVKAGYQIHRNQASTGVNQWNVSLGYVF